MKGKKILKKETKSETNSNGNHEDSVFTQEDNENQFLMKLQDSRSYDELSSIIANVTLANPVGENLFMGKYLVFLLDNLVPWQKPIGDYFKSAFVICAVKQKKLSDKEITESYCDTSVASPDGNPLLVKFEQLVSISSDSKQSAFVLQQISLLYNIFPLSISTGKQLLFMCSKLENHYKLPFIAICHGNSNGSLILYGAGGKNKSFSLKLLNKGKVSTLKNIPSVKDLKISHIEGLPSSLSPESSIEKFVSCTYEFLVAESNDGSNLVPVKDAHLLVHCSWPLSRAILEPLPTDCICYAELQTVAGADESGAFVRYKEIKLLKALQQSLKTGSMAWISSNSLSMILEEINELVNEEKKKIYDREYLKLPNDRENLESVIVKERFFLPLPDKLWLILKNCSSFGDLERAIEYIYKVLGELNITSAAACGNDRSTISKDIASMFNSQVYCPELDQNKTAELLLEIGVEKMRRDYFEYFISHNFITQDLFNQFTHPQLLSSEAIICLEKLHSVLELTLVCMKQLNLPKSLLNEFARSALKYFTTIPEIDLQHVFTIQIPTFDIRPVLNMMRPVIWELSLKSEDKNFMKQSCHRFVTTATHDHVYAPQNHNPNVMLKGASYVYSTATLVEEKV